MSVDYAHLQADDTSCCLAATPTLRNYTGGVRRRQSAASNLLYGNKLPRVSQISHFKIWVPARVQRGSVKSLVQTDLTDSYQTNRPYQTVDDHIYLPLLTINQSILFYSYTLNQKRFLDTTFQIICRKLAAVQFQTSQLLSIKDCVILPILLRYAITELWTI